MAVPALLGAIGAGVLQGSTTIIAQSLWQMFLRLGAGLITFGAVTAFFERETNLDTIMKKIVGESEWKKVESELQKSGSKDRLENFIKYLKDLNIFGAWASFGGGLIDPTVGYFTQGLVSAYQWSIGLGWLSWVALSPLLDALIAEPARDAAKYALRPKNLTRDEAEKIYARGFGTYEDYKYAMAILGYSDDKIDKVKNLIFDEVTSSKEELLLRSGQLSREKIKEILKTIGIKDEAIDYIIKTMYKLLPEDNIEKLYILGKIDLKQYEALLKLLGYSDETIQIKKYLLVYELLSGTTSKLIQAGIIDENQVRAKLREIGFSEHAAKILVKQTKKEIPLAYIDDILFAFPEKQEEILQKLIKMGFDVDDAKLIINAILARKSRFEKDLTKTDIKQLLDYEIITPADAKRYLIDIGYSEDEANLLIALWQKQMALKNKPKSRDLAKMDIVRLYINGLITREEAINLLKNLGYDDSEADLILKIYEKAKENASKDKKREITKTDIIRLYKQGLLDETSALNYLLQLGYKEEEAKLLLQSSKITAIRDRNLTIAQLRDAFRFGIMREDEIRTYLKDLGYDDNEVEQLMKSQILRYKYDWKKALEELEEKKKFLLEVMDKLNLEVNKARIRRELELIEIQMDLINALQDRAIIIKNPNGTFTIYIAM